MWHDKCMGVVFLAVTSTCTISLSMLYTCSWSSVWVDGNSNIWKKPTKLQWNWTLCHYAGAKCLLQLWTARHSRLDTWWEYSWCCVLPGRMVCSYEYLVKLQTITKLRLHLNYLCVYTFSKYLKFRNLVSVTKTITLIWETNNLKTSYIKTINHFQNNTDREAVLARINKTTQFIIISHF